MSCSGPSLLTHFLYTHQHTQQKHPLPLLDRTPTLPFWSSKEEALPMPFLLLSLLSLLFISNQPCPLPMLSKASHNKTWASMKKQHLYFLCFIQYIFHLLLFTSSQSNTFSGKQAFYANSSKFDIKEARGNTYLGGKTLLCSNLSLQRCSSGWERKLGIAIRLIRKGNWT